MHWQRDFGQEITSLQIFKELSLVHLEKLYEHLEILTSESKLDDVDIDFCAIDSEFLEDFMEKLAEMDQNDVSALKNGLMKFISRTLAEQEPGKLEGNNLVYYVELETGEEFDSGGWEGLEVRNLKHFLEVLEARLAEGV